MLDEPSHRKECFDEANSAWVKFANGQSFAFPKPWLEVYATFHGGTALATRSVLTYGPELDGLVKLLGECRDDGAFLRGAATLGACLLRQQYELSEEDLDQIFCFRLGDPESWGWAAEVAGIAAGHSGPKVGRGGGN